MACGAQDDPLFHVGKQDHSFSFSHGGKDDADDSGEVQDGSNVHGICLIVQVVVAASMVMYLGSDIYDMLLWIQKIASLCFYWSLASGFSHINLII